MEGFNYSVERKDNKKAIEVSLSGRLIDEGVASEMMDELNDLIAKGQAKFIFNLADLEYINSSGLNNLVNLLTRSRSKGGDIVLTNLSEKVKSLFIVTKLNTVFTVVENEKEALQQF